MSKSSQGKSTIAYFFGESMKNKKKSLIILKPGQCQFSFRLRFSKVSIQENFFYLHHCQNKLERLSPKITLLKMLLVLTQVEHQKH
jgi:hypothetical protein